MWLLDTKMITLSEQNDEDVRYAILSHRWGKDSEEVTFVDIQNLEVAQRKKGYDKIKRCCERALEDGYEWAWVDTCCIDKSSSSELQEAINSMYMWYEKAGVCYAYLQDVPSVPIERSEWFTRGWTLQELLAPQVVRFFDEGWNLLGDRLKLVKKIYEATSIRKSLLLGKVKLHDCSISERMSWAAARKTKRIEDRAYSLFGIFKVHLPFIYGEKDQAFQRLQQAILSTSEDDTLFAWTGVSKHFGGLLAPNLEAFRDGAQFRASTPNLRIFGAGATERRIGITTQLYPWCTDTYLVFLGCEKVEHGSAGETKSIVGIYLRTLKEDDDFARVEIDGSDLAYFTTAEYLSWLTKGNTETRTPYKPTTKKTWMTERSITVRQLPLLQEHQHYLEHRVYGFSISMPVERHLAYFIDNAGALEDHMKRQHNVYNMSYDESTSAWNPEKRILRAVNGAVLKRGIIGTLKSPHFSETRNQSKTIRDIHFGFDHFFNPTLFIRHNEVIDARDNIDGFCDGAEASEGVVVLYQPSIDDIWGSPVPVPQEPPKPLKPNEESDFWTEISLQAEHPSRPERNFWAFKGGRQSGLDTYLAGWEGARIKLTRRETDEGLIWDLEMDEYKKDTTVSTVRTVLSGGKKKKKKKSSLNW